MLVGVMKDFVKLGGLNRGWGCAGPRTSRIEVF